MILTHNQKKFLLIRKLKVGSPYLLPQWGFTVYEKCGYLSKSYHMDNNPMTKSLNSSPVTIKSIDNGFAEIQFTDGASSGWIEASELEKRAIMEMFLLSVITVIPMMIYNLFTIKWRTSNV